MVRGRTLTAHTLPAYRCSLPGLAGFTVQVLRRTRPFLLLFYTINGGGGGIRTRGTPCGGTHDFQSCPFGQLGHPSFNVALHNICTVFVFVNGLFYPLHFAVLMNFSTASLSFFPGWDSTPLQTSTA